MARETGWHMSKAVPIGLLAMIVLQLVSVVVWSAKLDARVEANEIGIDRVAANLQSHRTIAIGRIRSIEAAAQERAVVLGRIDERLKRIDAALKRIEREVAR